MILPLDLPLGIITVGGSEVFRHTMRLLLRDDPRCTLAGEIATAAQALELVLRHPPAVALVDACLPDSSGFELVECLGQIAPGCISILLSNGSDPFVVRVAQMNGAREVWQKESDPAELRRLLGRLILKATRAPTNLKRREFAES